MTIKKQIYLQRLTLAAHFGLEASLDHTFCNYEDGQAMTVIGGRYRDIIKQFFLPQLNDNNRGGFSFSREFYRIF